MRNAFFILLLLLLIHPAHAIFRSENDECGGGLSADLDLKEIVRIHCQCNYLENPTNMYKHPENINNYCDCFVNNLVDEESTQDLINLKNEGIPSDVLSLRIEASYFECRDKLNPCEILSPAQAADYFNTNCP